MCLSQILMLCPKLLLHKKLRCKYDLKEMYQKFNITYGLSLSNPIEHDDNLQIFASTT